MKNYKANDSSSSTQKRLSWSVICTIFFAIFILIFLIFEAHNLLSLLFGLFPAIIIMTAIEFWGMRELVRRIIFPGSINLVRRSFEHSFMVNRGRIILDKIERLLELVDCIENNNSYTLINYSSDELSLISGRIETMIRTYNKLQEQNLLTAQQMQFFQVIQNVSTQINRSTVSIGSRTCTLLQILQSAAILSELKNNSENCEFEDDNCTNDLKVALQETQDELNKIISFSELSLMVRIKKWFNQNTLGTLIYFKAELSTIYPSKSFFLRSHDNKMLDCMMIYANNQYKQENESLLLNDKTPTIIFSNPNAAYYEFSHFTNEWVELYQRKGINVFLWNYRGYGQSAGIPSIENTFKDAEQIVDYLRENEKVGLLGAHGQSLGGMVACHIAYKKNLDFLCADRTFSCFSDIALHSMGRVAKILMRLLTPFDIWSASNYHKAHCYKVLSFDKFDEVVCYPASLKNGVTRQIAQFILQSEYYEASKPNSQNLYHQPNNQSCFKNFKGFFLKTFKKDFTVEQCLKIWISEEDQNEIFNALKRLIDLNQYLSERKINVEINNHIEQKPKNEAQNNNNTDGKEKIKIELQDNNKDQKSNSAQSDKDKKKLEQADKTQNLSSTMDDSMIIEDIRLQEDSKITTAQLDQIISVSNTNNTINSQGTDLILSPISLKNEMSSNDQDVERQPQLVSNSSNQTEKDNSDYLPLIIEHLSGPPNSEPKQLIKIFKQIFSLLNSFDAGGFPLCDLFCKFKANEQFYIFQLFLLNLNIWGSSLPFSQIIRKKMPGGITKKYSIAKTKEFARKLEKISKSCESIAEIPTHLLNKILRDLSNVISMLRQLCERMESKKFFSNSGELIDLINLYQNKGPEQSVKSSSFTSQESNRMVSNGTAIVSLNSGQNTPEKKQKAVGGQTKVYSNLKEETEFQQDYVDQITTTDANKILGNLLPLRCGHNGNYSNQEIQIFEFHLKNAGFFISKSNRQVVVAYDKKQAQDNKSV